MAALSLIASTVCCIVTAFNVILMWQLFDNAPIITLGGTSNKKEQPKTPLQICRRFDEHIMNIRIIFISKKKKKQETNKKKNKKKIRTEIFFPIFEDFRIREDLMFGDYPVFKGFIIYR